MNRAPPFSAAGVWRTQGLNNVYCEGNCRYVTTQQATKAESDRSSYSNVRLCHFTTQWQRRRPYNIRPEAGDIEALSQLHLPASAIICSRRSGYCTVHPLPERHVSLRKEYPPISIHQNAREKTTANPAPMSIHQPSPGKTSTRSSSRREGRPRDAIQHQPKRSRRPRIPSHQLRPVRQSKQSNEGSRQAQSTRSTAAFVGDSGHRATSQRLEGSRLESGCRDQSISRPGHRLLLRKTAEQGQDPMECS